MLWIVELLVREVEPVRLPDAREERAVDGGGVGAAGVLAGEEDAQVAVGVAQGGGEMLVFLVVAFGRNEAKAGKG